MSEVTEGVRDARLVPSVTENPYWDKVKEYPPDNLSWKYDRVFSPNGFGDLDLMRGEKLAEWLKTNGRDVLVSTYSWAIPDPHTLAFVAALSDKGLVEVGAGSGYWAWQLTQLGVDVVAYDHKPPHLEPNYYHSPNRRQMTTDVVEPELREAVFFDVQQLEAVEAVERHPDRTLFLCWPPYAESMAARTLRAYRGDRVIYIGEGSWGCTGCAEFHALLESEWDEIATHRPVQWYGIHDWVTVYERAPEPRPMRDFSDDIGVATGGDE